MAESTLVAVLQADHLRCVEAGDRITLQVFVLRLDAFFLGLFFALEVFLVTQLGDHRFALVSLLDRGTRAVEVINRQQVQGHLGGQHDFFVVVAFVATHLVVDQETAELGQIFVGVELDRIFPLAHHLISAGPGVLAAGQVALGAQQFTFLEVIEQVFVRAGVVLFQQSQRGVNIAGGQLLIGLGEFGVVVAKRRTAGQQSDGAERNQSGSAECHGGTSSLE
ncbi:hypothetical protein D3C72_580440 [compost metagenome]